MKKIFEEYHKVFFALIAVLLLYPTLQKGYVMLLDWSVLPNISLADITWSLDSVGAIIYKSLSIILGVEIVQRIVLFSIVFFAGTAGFRLAKRAGTVFAQYFAGLLLIFNPLIYARTIEQPNIAGGTVLFFWFLVYFLEYLEDKNRKKIIFASILGAFSVSFFIHSVFFIGISTIILLFFEFLKGRNWKFSLRTVLTVFLFIIVFNSNWLFSFASGTTQGIGGIGKFSVDDVYAFATSDVGDNSVYVTVLALQGYWGEYQDRFVSIQENPLWSMAFVFIFALSAFGAWMRFKRKDAFAKPLLSMFLVAFVLAIGIASPFFESLALFLYQHIPLYIGLREPQKWVAVMVFVYAYFGAYGIKYLLEIKGLQNYRKEIGIFCAILPIIFSFSIINGMHKHLTPHEFPLEWQQAKEYLQENPTEEKILIFPWHSYMNLDFAEKNIIVPQQFFGKNAIRGNNTEFGGVYSHSQDAQTLEIEKYIQTDIKKKKTIDYGTFVGDMKNMDIGFVILLKAEDWQDYQWLDKIGGAKKVLENDKLITYKLQ